MKEFFYWMGVIFSGIFGLVGFSIIVGLLSDYCWKKIQNAYGLMEIMEVWTKHNRGKKKKTP